jgi:hypothetical protein
MYLNIKDLRACSAQKNNRCLLREFCEIYNNACGQDTDVYDVKVSGKYRTTLFLNLM